MENTTQGISCKKQLDVRNPSILEHFQIIDIRLKEQPDHYSKALEKSADTGQV